MGKKSSVILILLLITGLVFLGYFMHQSRKIFFTDPYKAVSTGAAIVIETVDLQGFLNTLISENGIAGEAGKVKEFASVNGKLKFLADQLSKTGIKRIAGSSSSVISLYYSGKGAPEPLLSMAVPADIKWRQLKEILVSGGIKTINTSMIAGNTLLELPFSANGQTDTVNISIISGLLLCTTSGKVMEEAILQTGRDIDIRSSPGFMRTHRASGKNEDKVFFIMENLAGLINTAFKQGVRLPDKISGTIEGDIYIDSKGLVFNGYAETSDSASVLHKYKSGDAGTFHTYKVLPASTTLFITEIITPANNIIRSANSSSQPAAILADKLRGYIGEEITLAYIDHKERTVNENKLIVYELKNPVYAEELFLESLKTFASATTNISWFKPDEQFTIPVYHTPFTGFNSYILPGFAKGFDDRYFTFYDNYLITGSSFNTLSGFLYDNLLNKTLANDITYREFESTLPSVASYFFYCVPGRITDLLAESFNEKLISKLVSNRNSLNKIQAIGYQLVPSNDMVYNSLSVRFREEAREESRTEWETLLDTVAAIKPFFFTNHLTGAKEIFIQDMKNNAYLVNSAGRVLWKVPLRERITGTLFMIDYFRNGKFQLLFSGRNFIHVLDRNGNYVERYPVRLRSPATSPIALFDYDNNKNYRLLVAGEDKTVYAYDKTGNVVKGWKNFKTTSIVTSEIYWFRVSGKDYLVLADETSLYFLDRTGSVRLTLKEPVTRAKGSAIRLTTGSDQSVVCTSPDGTVQHIYFDGSVKKFNMRTFSSDHSFDLFDIDGDGFGEYIFIDKGILYLYTRNRSEMFTRDFGSDQIGAPISFIFATINRKIGVYDINRKLIYLIDKNGDSMDGFPLRGASMFSIGKLSDRDSWNLIVGGTDRFLYNYKLNADN
jgi:hypothetical protein